MRSHVEKDDVPTVSTVQELETLLKEAEESGDYIEMTELEWQRLRDDSEQDSRLRRKAS